MIDLHGKVAIVTGANRYRGIGRSSALALARVGADVVVTGRERPIEGYPEAERAMGWRGAQSVAEEVQALGRRALALPLDVTDRDQVQQTVRRTLAELGRLDFLVNNAGAPGTRDRVPVVDLDEDVWDEVLRVNLTGAMICSKYAAREMIRQGQGGSIVNISSISGHRTLAKWAAYCASKYGITALTQAMALELGPHGIRVNAVCPGATDTERRGGFAKEANQWGVSVEEARERLARSIPLGKIGTPEDMANMVVFLCSEMAGMVTGQSINVCGGMQMN